MSENVICEKCGHQMSQFEDESFIGMECLNCSWEWVTSNIDPIANDQNEYQIILEASTMSLQNIKLITKIAHCNYLQARELILSAPTQIFSGTALDVVDITEKLENVNIKYRIVPEFPY